MRITPLRFDQHFDMSELDFLMSVEDPERILWLHLDYMRVKRYRMSDRESHRRLMAFDSHSRIKNFTEFPDW